MTQNNFLQGSTICEKGAALSHIIIISSGVVEVAFAGKMFSLEKGDAIGLCGLTDGYFGLTYKAATAVVVTLHQISDISEVDKLLSDEPSVAKAMVNSICRLLSAVLKHRQDLRGEADRSYALIREVTPLYDRLCTLYALTSKKLPGVPDLAPAKDTDPMNNWHFGFYSSVSGLDDEVKEKLLQNIGISAGLLQMGSADLRLAENSCKTLQRYLHDISGIFISGSGHDLFALLSELHLGAINIKGADAAVEMIVVKFAKHVLTMTSVDGTEFKSRYGAYNGTLVKARETQTAVAPSPTGGVKQNLADSLNVILDYSGRPKDFCHKFVRMVHEFRILPDKGSTDDAPTRMRRELTREFNDLYYSVLIKSFGDSSVPTIVKMFLNFGYVDAELAGVENADYLYSIADSLKGDPANGVFTISEWLAAIYSGRKDPCRNEFDMDYAAHVQDMKVSGKITPEQVAKLLKDKDAKLRFEIENTFPVVNKLTYGRVTTFCPLFSEYNVQRSLESSLVTPELLFAAINEIKGIDFSAFYRETLFSNPEIGVPKETVNVEVLPNIILMPNIGTRGMMWQEIEGRKRTTPCRMFMPIFYLSELKSLIIRLTGEFRWEMCKRIQGSRWQDITDLSLTSEYSDYLQFYRSNRDLSTDIKASVKAELNRARNNYKTVFVTNYVDWITYESQGLPRLNKNARRLMSTYCPFALAIRETLKLNPQYTEHLKRFNFKRDQREHQLGRLILKLNQTGVPVPKELAGELGFVKS